MHFLSWTRNFLGERFLEGAGAKVRKNKRELAIKHFI